MSSEFLLFKKLTVFKSKFDQSIGVEHEQEKGRAGGGQKA